MHHQSDSRAESVYSFTQRVLILSIQALLMILVGFLGILLAMPLLACMLVLVQMLYVEDVLGDRMDRPATASVRDR